YIISFVEVVCLLFFSSRRRHTRSKRDWSSDVCSSDLGSVMRVRGTWGVVIALAATIIAGCGESHPDNGETASASTPHDASRVDRSEERRVGKECRSRWMQ